MMHVCGVAVFAVLLSACASVPHDKVALSGTVDSVREAGATRGTAPLVPPGYGGAVGAAMVGYIVASGSTGPFHIYKIRMLDGQFLEVPAFAEVQVGSCVDVLVEAGKENIYSFWKPNEITLRSSMACPK
ncbi:hypothetical protein [Rugamonas sp. DEMB1]|uniref:hypothetical protein n=1 Tax=Rugamonas sp. DEMB1 TaxID=3039386 RepID=UPI00244BA846|nr:hypothetical protein [Rugamonas sp. DEMB1]WGG51499.1 hypothetical protein QC826_04370 [Rugamonas sp. DEMB1]